MYTLEFTPSRTTLLESEVCANKYSVESERIMSAHHEALKL